MIPSKEKLYELFVTQEMRQADIGRLYNVNRWTIRKWLKQYGLSAKDRGKETYKNKVWLNQQYWEEELSCQEIAALVPIDRATIQNWMISFGLPFRKSGEAAWMARRHKWEPNDTYQNREWLFGQYVELKRPSTEIADELGVATKTILNWLRRFDIPLFPRTMWLLKMWKDGIYDSAFCSPTSIEVSVQSALSSLGIEHKSQFRPSGYTRVYDEFIPPNTLLELHGNYWHDDSLRPGIAKRDEEKRKWAEDNGYRLIVFWENEINEVGARKLIEERILA